MSFTPEPPSELDLSGRSYRPGITEISPQELLMADPEHIWTVAWVATMELMTAALQIYKTATRLHMPIGFQRNSDFHTNIMSNVGAIFNGIQPASIPNILERVTNANPFRTIIDGEKRTGRDQIMARWGNYMSSDQRNSDPNNPGGGRIIHIFEHNRPIVSVLHPDLVLPTLGLLSLQPGNQLQVVINGDMAGISHGITMLNNSIAPLPLGELLGLGLARIRPDAKVVVAHLDPTRHYHLRNVAMLEGLNNLHCTTRANMRGSDRTWYEHLTGNS